MNFNKESEVYWNNKILEWENSYLRKNLKVSFVERLASFFRGPLLNRRNVTIDILASVIKHDTSLVELGCGSGDLLIFFQEKFNIKRCIGLDLSLNAIKFANEKIKKKNLSSKVEFRYFNCHTNSISQLNDGDLYFGLGFIDYLDLNEVIALIKHIESQNKLYLFSFPEKKISTINFLQKIYLKYQECPKFNKFNRTDFKKINNCNFLDIGTLTYITNL